MGNTGKKASVSESDNNGALTKAAIAANVRDHRSLETPCDNRAVLFPFRDSHEQTATGNFQGGSFASTGIKIKYGNQEIGNGFVTPCLPASKS